MIKKSHDLLWKRKIASTTLEKGTIEAYRYFFVLIYLGLFLSPSTWIHQMPDALFNPPRLSIAMFFAGFPDQKVMIILKSLIIITILLIGFRYQTQIAGIVFIICHVISSSLTYSFGKIDHGILLPCALLCFSLNDWTTYKDINDSKIRYKLPIPSETLLAIFIAFGMLTAGFEKGIHWIDFDINKSGFLGWFYQGYYVLGRTELLAPYVFNLPDIFIECLDYFVVLFELSPFLFLFSGKIKLWRMWILIACFFHLVNTLLLNIPFKAHILVYLPFIFPRFLINITKKRIFQYFFYIFISFKGLFLLTKTTLLLNYPPFLNPLLLDSRSRLWFELSYWVILCSAGIIKILEPRNKAEISF